MDGEPLRFQLRADYLVERAGLIYVADAKTGNLAISLRHAPTRRQLLEYQVAFRASGALLLDMEARRILTVRFRQ